MKYNTYENKNNKIIILYHGWGGSVNHNQLLINELYELGYTVIVPEIIYHDSRQPISDYFNQKNMTKYFWKCVFETINEFSALLVQLSISKVNIIVAGVSMGGFIASGILKNNKDLAGLICINGSPSFIISEEIFRQQSQRESMSDHQALKIQQYDPMEGVPYENDILMLHGDNDQVVSVEGVKHFFEAQMKANVIHTHLNIYNDINHTVEQEMVEDIKEWLENLSHK